MFRTLLQRLAFLSLIASFAFALGASPVYAQDPDGGDADITAPDENDASDVDTSDGGDDTADLTNETGDDGDGETADLTNETGDDGDGETADLTNETGDDGDDETADLTNETGDDGDADTDATDDGSADQVEELPSTGQGPQQDGKSLEIAILASVVLAVIAAFMWNRQGSKR